jgi:hypothetical protein
MADEIEITGINELLKKMDGFNILELLKPEMYRAVLRLQARMSRYPPPRAGSKYRRKGTYGKKWTHEVTLTAKSLTGRAGNNLLYGPYVGSERFQAWMHRGRWTTDQEALNLERHSIINDFQTAINTALED